LLKKEVAARLNDLNGIGRKMHSISFSADSASRWCGGRRRREQFTFSTQKMLETSGVNCHWLTAWACRADFDHDRIYVIDRSKSEGPIKKTVRSG